MEGRRERAKTESEREKKEKEEEIFEYRSQVLDCESAFNASMSSGKWQRARKEILNEK